MRDFEWDPDKEVRNARSHGVTFAEASTVFDDPLGRTVPDPVHSVAEERFVRLGISAAGRLLLVVHSERGPAVRIISARLASRRERVTYEQEPG
jgi:hypothetical protein